MVKEPQMVFLLASQHKKCKEICENELSRRDISAEQSVIKFRASQKIIKFHILPQRS